MYCHKHRHMTGDIVDGRAGGKLETEVAPDIYKKLEAGREQKDSIEGVPALANIICVHTFDPNLCPRLRLGVQHIEAPALDRRVSQKVPLGVVRLLGTIIRPILHENYKSTGTFRLANAKYVTCYRRRRNPHVSQEVHRDVAWGSPPGYLSIFIFLDNTDNGTGGLEIWENSIDTALDSRNSHRDLRSCRSVKFAPEKGSMIVFDGRLAHRGLANTSEDVRVGIHVFAWPNDSGLRKLSVFN